MLFPETGNVWVMPSMGLPRFETALLYPGTCLFEGTNLSEGRGTTTPFATIGAPFIDGQALSAAMQAKGLAGTAFTPAYFTPSASKFQGEACQGVQIHITDMRAISPVEVGVTLLREIMDRYEEAQFLPPNREGGRRFVELLCGSDILTRQERRLSEILEEFREDSRRFQEEKQQYHLYR